MSWYPPHPSHPSSRVSGLNWTAAKRGRCPGVGVAMTSCPDPGIDFLVQVLVRGAAAHKMAVEANATSAGKDGCAVLNHGRGGLVRWVEVTQSRMMLSRISLAPPHGVHGKVGLHRCGFSPVVAWLGHVHRSRNAHHNARIRQPSHVGIAHGSIGRPHAGSPIKTPRLVDWMAPANDTLAGLTLHR